MLDFKQLFAGPMGRYRLGISVLSLVVLAVIGVNVFGNAALRSDRNLEIRVSEIKTSVETYVSANNKLPAILADANVPNPGRVSYFKISDTRYMLCATYKTKSLGYLPISDTDLKAVQADSLSAGVNIDSASTHFSNGDNNSASHEKGYDCVYFSPYLLSESYLKPNAICNKRFKHAEYGHTVATVNTLSLNYSLYNSYAYGNTQNTTPKNYAAVNAQIFGSNCQVLSLADLNPGATVAIYYDDSNLAPPAVQITYSPTVLSNPAPVKK